MEIKSYNRKPFKVEAVEVTDENLEEVAEWVDGKFVRPENGNPYVKVNVYRPLSRRQTQAFAGDYVIKTDKGFKVYAAISFHNTFEEASSKEKSDSAIRLEVDPVEN